MTAEGGKGGELKLTGVSRRFGGRAAVSDLTLKIASGEVLCLLGASGCGKTTTLRLVAGLERVDAGEVSIAGEVVAAPGRHVPPDKRGVGLMFQDFALFPHLRVIDNVAFGLRGMTGTEREARASDLLERVGMTRYRLSYPHELSGGEQQRVALARALAPNPKILLMDEPFSSLDPLLRGQVRRDTFALLRGLGTTVLLVTHDPDEAMEVGDRIALMRGGRLAQVGPAAQMFDHPVDREAASFFGDINVIHTFVSAEMAPTAFGAVPAAAIANGTEVEVLVRPHAITLRPLEASGALAEVVSSRRTGSESVVELDVLPEALPEGACAMPRLRARMAEPRTYVPGEAVRVTVDLERALVFPCKVSGRRAKAHTPTAC